MTILHICAGWELSNGAANIARMVMEEQRSAGHEVSSATWSSIRNLRSADEVWIHCAWKPCLWWAALWGKNVHWMPEASYDPVRLRYHGWKKWLVGPVERFFLRKADRIVATCEAEKGWIETYLGKCCPKIEVVDVKRFFDLNRVERVDRVDGELHLLYLGRRHPLKGVEYLEAAVREVGGQRMVGQRTEDRGQRMEPCCRLRIVSDAFGEEKEKVWEWCDVLVLPTLSENFGLVIAEALERGKRVITTDGAPAWGDNLSSVEHVERVEGGEMLAGYGGRLIYLKGYLDGSDEKRVVLLKRAIERVCG